MLFDYRKIFLPFRPLFEYVTETFSTHVSELDMVGTVELLRWGLIPYSKTADMFAVASSHYSTLGGFPGPTVALWRSRPTSSCTARCELFSTILHWMFSSCALRELFGATWRRNRRALVSGEPTRHGWDPLTRRGQSLALDDCVKML